MQLEPNDRVLVLALPSAEEIRRLAEQVTHGIVVAVLDDEAVCDVRRHLRDYANVMITPADPEGSLPWRDNFFTVVYAPGENEPSREMLRVLAPGGTAWVCGGPVTCR